VSLLPQAMLIMLAIIRYLSFSHENGVDTRHCNSTTAVRTMILLLRSVVMTLVDLIYNSSERS